MSDKVLALEEVDLSEILNEPSRKELYCKQVYKGKGGNHQKAFEKTGKPQKHEQQKSQRSSRKEDFKLERKIQTAGHLQNSKEDFPSLLSDHKL